MTYDPSRDFDFFPDGNGGIVMVAKNLTQKGVALRRIA
jgi:hypothetical protein